MLRRSDLGNTMKSPNLGKIPGAAARPLLGQLAIGHAIIYRVATIGILELVTRDDIRQGILLSISVSRLAATLRTDVCANRCTREVPTAEKKLRHLQTVARST